MDTSHTSDKNTSKIEDLRLVRILDPSLVPKSLIEQIKNRQPTLEDFYEFNRLNCFVFDGESARINPMNHLYVLVDEDNKIKGVLWITIDRQECTINLFSIDKAYWNKGNALKFIHKQVDELMTPLGITKCRIETTNPGAYEKIGFKRSKNIIMEMEK